MKAARLVLALICLAGPVFSSMKRQALVIGNDAYPGNPLVNARNDARAVAEALGGMGYLVTLQLDANRQSLDAVISNFSNELSPSDMVFVYYAGHGLQIDGENYLVPVDFSASSPTDVRYQAYPMSSLFDKISARQPTTQVIILDACRDNPFLATRSLKKGWTAVEPKGTFLAFGTAPGSTANDNPSGGHGLFTSALLKNIHSADLDVNQLFEKVREDVIRDSNGLQVPWIASSLVGTLHLNPELDAAPSRESHQGLERSSAMPAARSFSTSRETASVVDDSSIPILIKQGLLLAKEENFPEAIRSLSGALAVQPESSVALRILGLIFHLLGRSEDAVHELSRAVAVDPTDARAYYDKCVVESNADPTTAIRDCEAALGLQPSMSKAHIGLAAAFLNTGQPTKAVSEINTAVSLMPGSPVVYSVRGEIARALGKYADAERDFHTAVRLNASSGPSR